MNTQIDQIIDSVKTLKPISPIYTRLIDLMGDPDTSLQQVSDLVSLDPSVASNILKLSNSAYFLRSRKAESIQSAVAFLGLNRIYDIILIQAVAPVINVDCSAYHQNSVDLWRHSICSAFLAKELGAMITPPHDQPNTLFTGALLKDIGKVVLQQYLPHKMTVIFELLSKEDLSFEQAERQVIGISHSEIGARLAERWHFSDTIVSAIRHHHNRDESGNGKAVAIIQTSDYLVSMMGIGTGLDGLLYRLDPQVEQIFTDEQLQMAMIRFIEKKDDLFRMGDTV